MSIQPRQPLSFQAFQALDHPGFVALLGPVVEHSAWVAADTWNAHPFSDWNALFEAMAKTLRSADPARQLALLRAHPELAGQEAQAGTMTPESQGEQGRLGLHRLAPEVLQRLALLNQRYRARFDFPFVAALRLHASLDSVLTEGEARLCHEPAAELELALAQVIQVMRGRLANTVLHDASVAPPHAIPAVSTLP